MRTIAFSHLYFTTMTSVFCLSAIFVFCLLHCIYSQKVVELDGSNFQKAIAENTMVLVDFYAPWCGHCKTLRPVLDRVAAQLAEQQIQCVIAAFDVSTEENEAFLQSEQIDLLGFPSLFLYKYGQKLSEYTGNRVEQDILSFLKSKSLPVAMRIQSYSEIEPLITSLEHNKYTQASGKSSVSTVNQDVVSNKDNHILAIVVGFFPSSSSDPTGSSNNSNLFMNIAMHFDLGLFFVTDSTELLNQFGIVEDSIVVFTSDKQHFKEKTISFTDKRSFSSCVASITSSDVEAAVDQEKVCRSASLVSEESIKRQILLECLPTVIPYSQDTQPLISSLPTKEHVLLFFNRTLEKHAAFVDLVESIGRVHLNNLLCIEVDVAEYQLYSFFNIRVDDLPQLVIVDMSDESDMKKYALSSYLQALHPPVVADDLPATSAVGAAQTTSAAASTLNKKPKPVVPVATSPLILTSTLQEIEDFIDKYVAGQLERSLLSEDIASLAASNANMAVTHVENIASLNFEEK